jgi:hypothetical protein
MNGINDCEHKHRVEGSIAFVPSVFGMTMASVAVKLLAGIALPKPREARETVRPCAHSQLSS